TWSTGRYASAAFPFRAYASFSRRGRRGEEDVVLSVDCLGTDRVVRINADIAAGDGLVLASRGSSGGAALSCCRARRNGGGGAFPGRRIRPPASPPGRQAIPRGLSRASSRSTRLFGRRRRRRWLRRQPVSR